MNGVSLKNGRWIYFVKKNGELFAKPTFVAFVGSEKTADEIVARLKELNPGREFVPANV